MVLKNFEIRIGTVGEYAKLKTFLSSAASLQRFNQVTGLKISGSDSGSAVKSDLNPNHLQVETVLEFNYAPVSLAAINANDKIFSKGEFDFSVIEKIRENMKTAINSLAIGTAGTSNPFQK
ncbi:MAG TPA: hypothetical protein DIT25_01580 [Candidatus Moranbacteria bacterium]|nr:hypothetical protein [Candidatus Moranbacteria bacterium]